MKNVISSSSDEEDSVAKKENPITFGIVAFWAMVLFCLAIIFWNAWKTYIE